MTLWHGSHHIARTALLWQAHACPMGTVSCAICRTGRKCQAGDQKNFAEPASAVQELPFSSWTYRRSQVWGSWDKSRVHTEGSKSRAANMWRTLLL